MSASKRRLRRKIERDLNDSGWVDKRIRERLRSGYTRKAQRARYIEPHFIHVIVNPNRKKK